MSSKSVAVRPEKKNQWIQLPVLTESVYENIFFTIKNRILHIQNLKYMYVNNEISKNSKKKLNLCTHAEKIGTFHSDLDMFQAGREW